MNVGAHVADVRRRWGGPKTAASGLVIADAVPLVGVVAFGWDLHSLLVVYWLESTVIGLETVAKYAVARARRIQWSCPRSA